MGETKMTQITYRLQLGGQAYSQLILFEDERSFDKFTDGNFEFGAQATAVALTVAAGADASTTGVGTNASGGENNANVGSSGFRKGMAIFTIAKGGQMYRATLGGQKVSYKPKSSGDCLRRPQQRAFFAEISSLAGNFTELIKKDGPAELEH